MPQTALEKKRDRLAVAVHDLWSAWFEHLVSRSQPHQDGSATIPPETMRAWRRQAGTRHAKLTELEQASDRFEADRMMFALEHE